MPKLRHQYYASNIRMWRHAAVRGSVFSHASRKPTVEFTPWAPNGRVQIFATAALLAVAGCNQLLDLGDYTFETDAPLGGAGGQSFQSATGGVAGSGGNSNRGGEGNAGSGGSSAGNGSGGTEANAGSGGSSAGNGSGGTEMIVEDAGRSGRVVDASSTDPLVDAGRPSDAGAPDAGPKIPSCGALERCVPPIPNGWEGLMAVSRGGASSCPNGYETLLGEVHSGLVAGGATCSCNCFVSGVTCNLVSANTGDRFAPSSSCESPPTDNDCLSAVPTASCSPQAFEEIRASSWTTTERLCGAGSGSENCGAGTCYPAAAEFGDLCIAASGDLPCPADFPIRTVYSDDLVDNRSCSSCTCSPRAQNCRIEIEVCSLGFEQFVLEDDDETCLNSSDGDGVTLLSTAVLDQGTCQTQGGALQGAVTEVSPRTVCCL